MKILIAVIASSVFALFSGGLLAHAQYGSAYQYYPYGYNNNYSYNTYPYYNGNPNLSYGNGALSNYNYGGNTPVTGQTLPASSISNTGAILNGAVLTNVQFAQYQFEYGTTPALGASTPLTALPGQAPANVWYQLKALAPNTTYFFRLVAQNDFGNGTPGQILSFTTGYRYLATTINYQSPKTNTAYPAATQNTTVSAKPATAVQNSANNGGNAPAVTNAYTPTNTYGMGAQLLAAFGMRPAPCLTLSGKLSSTSVSPGGTISYAVSGKNTCGADFTNVVLRITLPDAVKLASSTSAYSTVDGNTYIYDLGDFPRSSALSVGITGVANEDAPNNTPIAFTATIDFNDAGAHQMIGTTSSAQISVSFLASIANLFHSKGGPASPANGPIGPADTQVSDISGYQIGSSGLINLFLILMTAGLVAWLVTRRKNQPVPARPRVAVDHQNPIRSSSSPIQKFQ
jgi:uncharacterized repeat protein (TIGR01451 family)